MEASAVMPSTDALFADPAICFTVARSTLLRGRGLGEERFEAAAAAAGWAVESVPLQQLHVEYQDGAYRILRLVKMDLA